MKKFTLSLLCTMAALLCSVASYAQFSITDVFGRYEFSANLELTEAGQEYADLFKSSGEVTIQADDTYFMAQVSPFAGGVETHYVNTIDAANNKFVVYNTNGNSYYYWGTLAIANIDGDYPYASSAENMGFQMEYTYDPETGNISLPDFTAVSCRAPEDPVVVMAKFTNCKLTLVEKFATEIVDLTGEYAFSGSGSNEESAIGKFDFTLTATSEDFKQYTVVIQYPDFQPVTIEGATFDGQMLTWHIDKTYLDTAVPYVFATLNPMRATGDITWQFVSAGKLSLYSGMVIAKVVDAEKELEDGTTEKYQKLEYEQWYLGGVAKDKNLKEASLAGTYKVVCESPYFFIPEEEANFPKEFTIVVEDGMFGAAVTEFMGFDTYSLNYGGIPCAIDGNTLKIEAGGESSYLNMANAAEDYSWVEYDVLYNAVGEAGDVTITVNEDGTCTISDFFIKRLKQVMNDDWSMTTVEENNVAYYGYMTITKDGGDNQPQEVALAGTHKVTYAGQPKVYDGDSEWPTEFNVVVEEYEGTYYVTEFMGFDTYTMNYGGIVCEAEGNTLKMQVGDYSSYLAMAMGEIDPETGFANPISFDILYDGEGKAGYVTLTVNEDGSASISDFVIKRQLLLQEGKMVDVVAYASNYVPDAIKGVAGANAAGKVYDLNGKCVGNSLQNLPKGVYVVKRAGKAVKVAK